MKQSRLIMGMPVALEIDEPAVTQEDFEAVFSYLRSIDDRFSPFKETSEVSAINKGLISPNDYSQEMKTVLKLSEQTRQETDGYFNVIRPDGTLNPSGLVKGWAISEGAKILRARGIKKFYLDVAGDIQAQGRYWKIGIRNPFKEGEIVKTVYLKDQGIATSGTYIRGQHIYNPRQPGKEITEIVSLSIIGKDVYDADRFATASFAMGKRGIMFIESLKDFEGYMIDAGGLATLTSGFEKLTQEPKE